jgi:YHS domain-containing protein
VSAENKAAFDKAPDAYVYAECPVTGKVFLRKDAGATSVYDGATYYFCCKGCEAKFKKDPKKYAGPARGAGEGCTHDKGAGAMKEGTAEGSCSAKKTGACPMAKDSKKS